MRRPRRVHRGLYTPRAQPVLPPCVCVLLVYVVASLFFPPPEDDSGGVNDCRSGTYTIFVPQSSLLTPSPHPYVPTGATTLTLALLFGIGIFFGAGRDASGGKKR